MGGRGGGRGGGGGSGRGGLGGGGGNLGGGEEGGDGGGGTCGRGADGGDGKHDAYGTKVQRALGAAETVEFATAGEDAASEGSTYAAPNWLRTISGWPVTLRSTTWSPYSTGDPKISEGEVSCHADVESASRLVRTEQRREHHESEHCGHCVT